MINPNKVAISLTMIGLFAFAGAAGAATAAEAGIESEVNSCIAEVRERVNYDDATRIRHDVVAVERRTVGWAMRISTAVYGDSDSKAIRAYAATCVINGNNKPLRFAISEVD